ncbi:MAG: NACHT domain-containing protein, partial [Ktedonobacteraceae bacterium]
MEVILITGLFTIIGVLLGIFGTYFTYHQNIQLQNRKLFLEIEQLQRENKQLAEALQNNISLELRKYLSSLINELGFWKGGLGLGRTFELEEIYVWVDLENQGEHRGAKIRDSELLRNLVETKNSKHQNALIIGGPGSGKSTLIRRWAYILANDILNKPSEYMLFYIPLNIVGQLGEIQTNPNWKMEELAFKQIYGLSYLPKDNILAALEENISQGRAIIFLDAADEVPEDKRDFVENWINSLSNYNPNNLIILTSRPSTYADQMKNFERYNMVDFEDEQITDFVERWFSPVDLSSETKKEVIDFILSAERVLKSNPLFLTMLCILVEMGEREEIPSPGALFERFVRELLKYWPEEDKKL